MIELREIYKSKGQDDIASMFDSIKPEMTLVLNSNNTLVKHLLKLKDDMSKKDLTETVCRQLYDLALMAHKPLDPEEMTDFIDRSNRILELLVENEDK